MCPGVSEGLLAVQGLRTRARRWLVTGSLRKTPLGVRAAGPERVFTSAGDAKNLGIKDDLIIKV